MNRTRAVWLSALATVALAFGVGSPTAQADGFGGTTTPGAAPTMVDRPNTCKQSLETSRDAASDGDPIWAYDGSLHLNYTDLAVGRNFPIAITRLYDSRSEYDSAIGYGWAFTFDRRLFEYPDGSIVVRSGCGSRSRFVLTGGAYVAPLDGMQGQLTALGSGQYELRHPSGAIDRFDADGRLSKIISANGAQHELLYDSRGRLPLIGTSPRSLDPNTPMLVAYQPRVTRIQERGADGVLTGYYVDFQYNDTTGRVTKVIANDGREVHYGFDVAGTATRGNLVSVTGLNDYNQSFAYVVSSENPDPHNITSITDGTGAQPVITKYDAQDRVYQQIEQITVWNYTYPSAGTTTVEQQVKATDGTGATLQTRTTTYLHDAGGYLTKAIDPLGHETRYVYDGNRDITRIERWEKQGTILVLLKAVDTTYNGQGQPLTQTVTLDPVGGQAAEVITSTWTYDNGWVASEQIVSNKFAQIFRTEYTFNRDAQNRPVSIAQIKRRKDNGTFATTSFTYCTAAEAAAGGTTCPDTQLIKQVDGPRTDVSDIVTFTYYGTTDTSGCAGTTGNCWRRGDRKTIVNALGQTIEFQRYDAAGRAIKIRDANNVIAELSYHPRGWLLQQIVRGPNDTVTTDDQITSYTTDARGNVTRITAPDGNYADLTYDIRDRLTKIRDLGGNELTSSYDSAGNVQQTEAWATVPSFALKRKQRFLVDALDRVIEAQGSTTDKKTLFAYDAAGRQTLATDANSVQSLNTYDDLDRLVATVADSASGGLQASTGMAYDAAGHLRAVVDPKGLTTSYVYDALGRMTQQISPDSGTTTYTYDDTGNRTSMTDARGITVNYSYDALNRPIAVTYPTAAENVSYSYDTPHAVCQAGETFSVGRLSQMTDRAGRRRTATTASAISQEKSKPPAAWRTRCVTATPWPISSRRRPTPTARWWITPAIRSRGCRRSASP
jgi:YD repeat-containing protein